MKNFIKIILIIFGIGFISSLAVKFLNKKKASNSETNNSQVDDREITGYKHSINLNIVHQYISGQTPIDPITGLGEVYFDEEGHYDFNFVLNTNTDYSNSFTYTSLTDYYDEIMKANQNDPSSVIVSLNGDNSGSYTDLLDESYNVIYYYLIMVKMTNNDETMYSLMASTSDASLEDVELNSFGRIANYNELSTDYIFTFVDTVTPIYAE